MVCICFYPTAENKLPKKYHTRNLKSFLAFAIKQGFIYYNVYGKESKAFFFRVWISENIPNSKNGNGQI